MTEGALSVLRRYRSLPTLGKKGRTRSKSLYVQIGVPPVNELAGQFAGIGARTIPTTIILDPEGRVAARLLGLTDTREIVALASAVLGSE